MLEKVIIRDFDPATDYPGAYQAFYSGFHHILWPWLDEAAPEFTNDMIRAIYTYGNKGVVAEVDAEVVGILFGTAPLRWSGVREAGSLMARFLYQVMAGRYNMSDLAKKHLWQLSYGHAPYLYKHPNWRYDISLFTLVRECRGIGLGRKMMDAFIGEVVARNARYATVCTDSTLSWHFYEVYGFKRIVTFPMKAYKYSLPDTPAEGYIYSLNIERYTERR